MQLPYKRIIVKVGSNVLTRKDGLPDQERMEQLVSQVARLREAGLEVILVSSGAVAFGRSLISVSKKYDTVAARQLLASTGQVHLINAFARFFDRHQTLCSQVLVTKEDFRDRLHYLHMKNCFEILLQHKVVPVVNENDVISVTELMFTDNDELAGLIASMLNAQALILLSNVDGIFKGDPGDGDAELIEEVSDSSPVFLPFISARRSQFGRGGMITKTGIARKAAGLGITVHIANGTTDDILLRILNNEVKHTRFTPKKSASGKKKWIAHAGHTAKGTVLINEGAKAALTSARASSLLPVGIIAVRDEFQKGEVIRLLDEKEQLIGLGIAEYNSEKARERVGQKKQKPLVHYDYLFLNTEI
ncbi:glutamate 5-kinase [Anseongella ginsenosidimutans]|uniref:Glutamate 5-kinase n=1 Tax=Anseongella ginsenosidimutans TaxID=496056 RepID=A0A4R3KV82_9SPHI|nr:glutamate 5-kinase [Anseongella ginsenosidimutans]QEC53391.1 glutamate 5-kinase [Anseongella ginsenosidimutans]TCS88279.1 glutamate 5-kinase [Anseongella ginsenosidimutans]